jgi:hypothetical protein
VRREGETMDYEVIKALANHHRQSFGRIVRCEIYELEEGRILSITRLHDDFHDMNLAMLLSGGFVIEEVAGKMDRIPYPCCETKPIEMLAELKGICIAERGGLKKIKERIPRKMGCTHLYEMLELTFRSVFAGVFRVFGKEMEGILHFDMEEARQHAMTFPELGDTCYGLSRDSADPAVLERALKKLEEARREAVAIAAVKRKA